tara:strand:+ start:1558 stop:2526 length:969 start_codon:yes stop_codon:yes gene_type:complete
MIESLLANYSKTSKQFTNITNTMDYIYYRSFPILTDNSILSFYNKEYDIKGRIYVKIKKTRFEKKYTENKILIIKSKNNVFDILNFIDIIIKNQNTNIQGYHFSDEIIIPEYNLDKIFHKDKDNILNLLHLTNKIKFITPLLFYGKSIFYKYMFIKNYTKTYNTHIINIDLTVKTHISNLINSFNESMFNNKLIIIHNFDKFIKDSNKDQINSLFNIISISKNVKVYNNNVNIIFLTDTLNFPKYIYEKFIKTKLLSSFKFDNMDYNSFNKLCKYYFNKEISNNIITDLKIDTSKLYNILFECKNDFNNFIETIIKENNKII